MELWKYENEETPTIGYFHIFILAYFHIFIFSLLLYRRVEEGVVALIEGGSSRVAIGEVFVHKRR